MGLEGNPNSKYNSKISRRGFLIGAGVAALGGFGVLGYKADKDRVLPEIKERDFDLRNVHSPLSTEYLPVEYKERLTNWIDNQLFKDPRVLAQVNNFITSVKAGEQPIFEGSVDFDKHNSLPQLLEGGDEEFSCSINTNFKFTDGISHGLKLHEDEIVIAFGVGLKNSDLNTYYGDHRIAIGRSGTIFTAHLIYNASTGSIREFPPGAQTPGEIVSDLFKV